MTIYSRNYNPPPLSFQQLTEDVRESIQIHNHVLWLGPLSNLHYQGMLLTPITNIINLIRRECVLPDRFKQTLITPLISKKTHNKDNYCLQPFCQKSLKGSGLPYYVKYPTFDVDYRCQSYKTFPRPFLFLFRMTSLSLLKSKIVQLLRLLNCLLSVAFDLRDGLNIIVFSDFIRTKWL